MSSKAYSPDFRSHIRDLTYPWRAVTPDVLAQLRTPHEDSDAYTDEVGAARELGIDTAMLRGSRERLRIPRVDKFTYRVFELHIWIRLNDPLALLR